MSVQAPVLSGCSSAVLLHNTEASFEGLTCLLQAPLFLVDGAHLFATDEDVASGLQVVRIEHQQVLGHPEGLLVVSQRFAQLTPLPCELSQAPHRHHQVPPVSSIRRVGDHQLGLDLPCPSVVGGRDGDLSCSTRRVGEVELRQPDEAVVPGAVGI